MHTVVVQLFTVLFNGLWIREILVGAVSTSAPGATEASIYQRLPEAFQKASQISRFW